MVSSASLHWGQAADSHCHVCVIVFLVVQNPVTNFDVHLFWEIFMSAIAALMLSQSTKSGFVCRNLFFDFQYFFAAWPQMCLSRCCFM